MMMVEKSGRQSRSVQRRATDAAIAWLWLSAAASAIAAPAPVPASAAAAASPKLAPSNPPLTLAPLTPAPLTPAQIARAAIPSIVLIRSAAGQGTGFFAGGDGRIITNFHVIRGGASDAVIITADQKEHKDIEVIALDAAHDLAVLRIGARGQPPLQLGDSTAAGVGEHVVAIGNPLGFGDTISDGLLSGVREFEGGSVLQISAPISSGSSGGPVLNDRGEVIGVSTFVITRGQNLNFAVPINSAKPLLKGTTAKPLSAYAAVLGAQTLVRHIPNHPRSILNNCPAPQLRATYAAIASAINLGAPLYNDGNYEACYRIYAGAAREVDRTVAACAGPKAALATGIANADKLTDWSDKAWAMRDAFDGLIALTATPAPQTPVPPAALARPVLAPAALAGCDGGELRGIASAINSAIKIGGPLFDAGNPEACYRIYAGVVAEVARKAPGCPAPRKLLDDSLAAAERGADPVTGAWVLRGALDAISGAIAGNAAVRPTS